MNELKQLKTKIDENKTFGLHSSDKCSEEEIKDFRLRVINFLNEKGISETDIKMRCQRNYGGNIKINTYFLEVPNQKKSIRKLEDGNYYKGKFGTKMTMGVYFYRTEWADYLKDKDQQEWDIADIKKHYRLRIKLLVKLGRNFGEIK